MKNRKDMKISGWSFEYKSPPENKFPDGCDKFVSLHNHTEYSFLDGMQRVERGVLSLDMDSLYEEQITLVRRAKQLKQPGVGVSDHGTMGSFFRFHTECVNNDINPVIGIEFYFVNDLKEMIATKDRHYFHVTVFAKNYEGLLNIFRMNKIGWTDGFYYKPKIDWQVLKKFNKNIIGTSGCTGDSPYFGIIYSDASPRNKRIMLGDLTKKFMDIWGDDFYFEIMPNKDYQPSIDLNKTLLELSEKFNVKLVATSDTHYTLKEHADSHEVLLCVQTHKSITDPNRLRFGNGELYLKSRKEIYHDFRKYHDYIPKDKLKEALDNTIEINKQVHIVIPKKYASDVLPKPLIPVEYGNNINLYVKGILKKGWNRRNIKLQAKLYAEKCNISFDKAYDDYKKRLNSELKVIKKMGFIEYFLIIYELLDFCRKNNIFFGPGRGSSAASLVCYLLGITSIDPILYDLMFERFISIYKVTYPDIDLDFDWHKRHLIFDWMEVRFGINCFAHIGSYSVLKGKAVLRDVCRVFDIPLNEVNQITKYVIERSGGDERKSMTISDSFKEFDTMKEFDKKYPFIKKHAIALEGTIRNGSCHPCAVAVSDKQLSDIVPIETRGSGKEKMVISAVTGKENEKLGLLKIDILGLKTLSVIYETIKLVDEKNFDIYRINLEDKKVINEFSKLNFTGVFQFDSIGMRNTFRNYEFKEFDDIIACNALYRPGTMRSGITTDYINRKMGKKIYNKIHPTYDRITEKTAGCVIYQEQITQIFGEMAGYDLSDSDQIRLAIAKSHGKDIIGKHRESFMEGCLNVGLDKKKSKRLFDQIVMFGSYGFNKCLTIDTKVFKSSANQFEKRTITLGELYKRWYSKTAVGNKYKNKTRGLKIARFDIETQRIRMGKIKAIYLNGVKKVYKITTNCDYNIKATINERFLTNKGYKRLWQLTIDDELMVSDLVYEQDSYKKNNQIFRNRPCYVNGRTEFFTIAKEKVLKRSQNKCENCSLNNSEYKHVLEFAHIKSFKECNNNFELYHNESNLKLLCNSCHKLFDYGKGERKIRYSKGYPVYYDKIVSINYVGEEMTYDVEMDDNDHNFVANNIVVHNSHASAYSVISYWCMYLKYYYSLEFMTSLLAEEHDDDNIKRYMKECQRLGISIIKPDINKSKMYFSSDKSKREIIVGFLFIKGIGEKSANEIVINQPFDNFDDFIKKINRRIISIRVIKALILSGSFVQWCKNTKKMYENIEEVLIKKKDSAKMFEQFDQEKDWDEETALMMQRKVLKLLTKNHPVFYYHDIIKSFFPNIKLTKLEDIDFSKRQYQLFTIGEIIDLKFNQIGDFDKVKPTISEIEKRKLKLAPQGSRYANFDLEDETGFRRFSAVPIIFNKNRAIFEKGKGTLILIKFRIVKNIGMAYVERMIDLTELKEKKKITNSDGKFLISKSCTQYMEKYKTKLSRNEIVCTFVDLKFYRTRNNDIMSFALLYSDYTDKCYDVLMFSNVIRDKLGHLRDWYVKDKILIVQLSKLQNKNDSPVKYQVVNIKRAVL